MSSEKCQKNPPQTLESDLLNKREFILLRFTCAGASVAQVRGDGDRSALVHAHAPQTFIDAFQQATLAEQGHLGVPSLVAVEREKTK